jgi:N-acetylglutamate synthase-like GNAT family acetyltransferase
MSLSWVRENGARWDADRERIVAGAEPGVFELPGHAIGDAVSGEWWRVESDGRVVGYGWMDCTWEGAEMLLAVDRPARRHGVGTFILDSLEKEAGARGVEYLFNTVRPTHPQGDAVTAWLQRHGFTATDDGELRRRVHAGGSSH